MDVEVVRTGSKTQCIIRNAQGLSYNKTQNIRKKRGKQNTFLLVHCRADIISAGIPKYFLV